MFVLLYLVLQVEVEVVDIVHDEKISVKLLKLAIILLKIAKGSPITSVFISKIIVPCSLFKLIESKPDNWILEAPFICQSVSVGSWTIEVQLETSGLELILPLIPSLFSKTAKYEADA